MPVNPMPLTIGEILQKIKEAKTKPERVKILKENTSDSLKHFLRLAFDPNILTSLPKGVPPYTPNPKPNGFGDTTIKASLKSFYVFFEKSAPHVKQKKRELLFIHLLEALDKQESDFLLAAINKKLDIGITTKVIEEVYPGLLSKPVDKKPVAPEGSKDEIGAPKSNS